MADGAMPHGMHALVFDHTADKLYLQTDRARPVPGPDEALIRVTRAGICSTDLEITRGYVPGFHAVLGHEFVGVVEACDHEPEWVGHRVVGEINVNCTNYGCADAVFERNHAPDRTVLGIIGKDGALAQYLTLPAANLHLVPEALTDAEAVFAEPLAAACRILEQGLLEGRERIAVLGDGKLGLLVSQVLAVHAPGRVHLFGRHEAKMRLVSRLASSQLVDESTAATHSAKFDLVVEATGSSASVRNAIALVRPMGTLVLKSTVSLNDTTMPGWSELANDLVVNEKVLVGSRCGPFDLALQLMHSHEEVRSLLRGMVHKVFPIHQALDAMAAAQEKGALKVHISMVAFAEELEHDATLNLSKVHL